MSLGKPRDGDTVIRLGERILFLLQHGSFTSTYKYAVLLGLIDLCCEHVGAGGAVPQTLTTRQLAEAVARLYWHHVVPYPYWVRAEGQGRPLRQSTGSQARIVRLVQTYRERQGMPGWSSARHQDPEGFAHLLDEIEWTLIKMPLPRLQRIGGETVALLYRIPWTEDVSRGAVRAYQRGEADAFDNRIQLLPGVGEALVRLAGILRPVIQREWARKVAAINRLPEARLERFLFEQRREELLALRRPLAELQRGYCFYCAGKLGGHGEVDHFVPFARHPNDGIANLVVAHARCNRAKRDFIAASEHLEHWYRRNWDELGRPRLADLEAVAAEASRGSGGSFEVLAAESLAVARAIYLGLPDEVPLWRHDDAFEVLTPPVRRRIARILHSAA